MARKNKNTQDEQFTEKINIFNRLKEETLQGVLAVVFFVLAIFFSLASLEKAGFVGDQTYKILKQLFGMGYFLIPIVLVFLGISFLRSLHRHIATTQSIGAFLLFISGLGMIELTMTDKGGIVGYWISHPLTSLFDVYATFTVLGALMIISSLILLDTPFAIPKFTFIRKLFSKKEESQHEPVIIGAEDTTEKIDKNNQKKEEPEEVEEAKPAPITIKKFDDDKKEITGEIKISAQSLAELKPFTPPPLSLLERDKGKPGVGDIKANSNIIKRTLQNFGITVEMDEISIGPSVTRYALKPAEGVKLSKIVALQDNLALALAAHPLRIEAPIPGKSLVGIEIPNASKTTVGLASMLSADEYQNSDKPLLVALGKGVSGISHFGNLAKMPHLLIAGATGSGKSVTIHTIITSLLYRNPPENMKFIMIDPKRVELTLYNKIPHLLTPVITEPKKAILSLKWAAKEMDRRYDILEKEAVRDIQSYHKTVLEPAIAKLKAEGKTGEDAKIPETMPYIVVIIDELADIMTTYPRELEAAIVRLAQMSRAVGIHLILSTQRPSVNVITGLIKANVPSRIALQVASQIDSRTILDAAGAEKLLGAGDMLYMSGDMSKPVRVQSAYISETELKKVVQHLAQIYKNEIPSEIDITSAEQSKNVMFEGSIGNDSDEADDDLYEEAHDIVVQAGKASTSYLQRKLRVGYARAARLMDMLEERGVIAPGSGSKPREVLEKGSSNSFAKEDFGEDTSGDTTQEENISEENKQL